LLPPLSVYKISIYALRRKLRLRTPNASPGIDSH
jgi:hypothetical protein